MEEERYDDELANIKATMAKEKSIIEQIVTEPAPSNVEENTSENDLTENDARDQAQTQSKPVKNKSICRFYKTVLQTWS